VSLPRGSLGGFNTRKVGLINNFSVRDVGLIHNFRYKGWFFMGFNTFVVQELADVVDDLGAHLEDTAGFVVEDEVEVALSVPNFLVLQPCVRL
jgi:hypothetical protein